MPTSCYVGSNNCAQCLADLQTDGFTQQAANEVGFSPVTLPPGVNPVTVPSSLAAQGYVLRRGMPVTPLRANPQ